MTRPVGDQPIVLTIAGSDSGGGAGIQADIKAIHANGGYAVTALTAITAQNTTGVAAVEVVSPRFLEAQLNAILSDFSVAAMKTGMLATAEHVETIASVFRRQQRVIPLVIDPVLVATSGDKLADPAVINAYRNRLFPHAMLITPNADEWHVFGGAAANWGAPVLRKGGDEATHRDYVEDRLYHPDADDAATKAWRSARVEGGPFHGTGCTLSAAIATELGHGRGLESAIERARAYVRTALAGAWSPGHGARVLDH
ncbi:MAG: bifunctional hydroxymethylpyrimidine kinase/phosphomethylpyrimidine kinase [Pseudomonadota bacterium]